MSLEGADGKSVSEGNVGTVRVKRAVGLINEIFEGANFLLQNTGVGYNLEITSDIHVFIVPNEKVRFTDELVVRVFGFEQFFAGLVPRGGGAAAGQSIYGREEVLKVAKIFGQTSGKHTERLSLLAGIFARKVLRNDLNARSCKNTTSMVFVVLPVITAFGLVKRLEWHIQPGGDVIRTIVGFLEKVDDVEMVVVFFGSFLDHDVVGGLLELCVARMDIVVVPVTGADCAEKGVSSAFGKDGRVDVSGGIIVDLHTLTQDFHL